MKIRDKLLLGFGLYILLASVLGFFAHRELRTIGSRLALVETADDIENEILEVRRHEKNFLLYRNDRSLEALRSYLGNLKQNVDTIKTEIVHAMEPHSYEKVRDGIAAYERLIEALSANYVSQAELSSLVRIRGRDVERKLSGQELAAFLIVRRHEKNIVIEKTAKSFRVFETAIDPIVGRSDIEQYHMLMKKLYLLFEEEQAAIGAIRTKARDIQEITENLSRKERMRIATTLKMSMNLLLLAFVLVVVIGALINVKLAGSIASPLRNLEKISKKIAAGDFSERIEVRGKDELASLETAFNHMGERLKNAMWSLEHAVEKLREKQAQLVEAEKLAAVGKLAAGIAHEINNPLTSVLTFSNLMLEKCDPADPCRDRLKLMARETERARNIVRQLLNFGREIIIKPEKISINRPAGEIVDSLYAQDAFKGIDLRTDFAADLPEVFVDPAQIGQVVLNMLLNAIHSITPPGRISITTRSNGQFVELNIEDSGQGIPEGHLHRIFDPFFTTKDMMKGTGLGLAVSYGIIKKHGGDIEVASVEGKGTSFTVRLPIHG